MVGIYYSESVVHVLFIMYTNKFGSMKKINALNNFNTVKFQQNGSVREEKYDVISLFVLGI